MPMPKNPEDAFPEGQVDRRNKVIAFAREQFADRTASARGNFVILFFRVRRFHDQTFRRVSSLRIDSAL